jgi:pilus assembly protein CpaE
MPALSRVPVILFTAKSQVDDKITGFEAGADDYLTKPVTPAELVARVKALLLRASYTAPAKTKARVIGFLGVKGGVGTSSAAVNVAVALAKQDKEVLLIECQPHTGTVARQMGLRPRGTLASLGGHPAEDVTADSIKGSLVQHQTGVRVIPSPVEPGSETEPLTSAHIQALIEHLDGLAEIVILDLGSQTSPTVCQLLERCDRVVYVSEVEEISLALAKKHLENGPKLGVRSDALVDVLVVNRVRMAVALTKPDVEEMLEQEVIGFMTPAPELFRQAAREGQPALLVQPDGLQSNAFRQLAQALV